MADFNVSDETTLILDGIRAFLDAEVRTREEKLSDILDDPHRLYGADGRYHPEVVNAMREVREASANAGYYSMFVPASVGGGGQDFRTYYDAWEALYHHTGPGRVLPTWALAHWATGPNSLHRHLDPSVQTDFLEPLLSGRKSSCFALSEPDAGSDVWNIRTRAVRDGDVWRISGTKQWITNSPYADCGIVFAVTDPERAEARTGGVSAFVFDTGQAGFHVDSVIRLFGHPGGDEGILSFDGLEVPDANRLGPINEGFPLALEGVNFGRLYNGARSVGLARWALERATEYAKNRETFGQPIAEHQAVQILLADSAIEIYAARAAGLHAAWKVDQGGRAIKELSMMKAFSTESCFRVYDRAIQVFGGMGVTNEMRLVDGLHTARTIRIADGTQEILRRTIARQLLRGDFEF
ncbi:MAG TPA: acyl-CoA dehydrogenase family protein [Dehalococcoidia bacterium]|nr:acyl-CoA dehydrogenase family protein [Dehalococcoidia bacterium]